MNGGLAPCGWCAMLLISRNALASGSYCRRLSRLSGKLRTGNALIYFPTICTTIQNPSMWLLPKLQWKDSSWRLPLSERSAAILATALLEEPASRLRKISQLLSTEPSLSMWVFCQAPSWRESAPPDVTEPAEWLCEAIGNGLFHVESDPNQDSPNQTSSAVELEVLRKCPWFPQWMNAAAADGAADALQQA